MAKKLYVFGIGGTGARVMKALTLLLASGVKLPQEFDTVVPILIDPDTSNGDLNRTKEILTLYQQIRNEVHEPVNFFSQEIKTINELSDKSGSVNPDFFQFKLEDVDNKTFGEFIAYNMLHSDFESSKDDKSFMNLLYSEKNLNSDLSVGFKGNPNMGSIVLDQFTRSDDFKKFAQTFSDGDAIFIVSSIFGGTGAAGFPLLLKNLRGNEHLSNHSLISSSKIGAVSMLPYFTLDAQDEVKSESFTEKAKAALDYYNRTIIDTNSIDSLYYLGNKRNSNSYKYAVGKIEQKNDAHFLEMAAALAVFDFCEGVNISAEKTLIKEFGIENNSEYIRFQDLNARDMDMVFKPLTKFKLFSNFLELGLEEALKYSRWTKSNIMFVSKRLQSTLNKKYFTSPEYHNQIGKFIDHFQDWTKEMMSNKPSFSPFVEVGSHDAMEFVKDFTPKGKKDFNNLNVENSTAIKDNDIKTAQGKVHSTLIKLFDKTTEKVLKDSEILN